jgi:MFS family permease
MRLQAAAWTTIRERLTLQSMRSLRLEERPRVSHPGRARRAVSFWVLAVLLGLFLFAASAPSPLYAVYAAKWHFSSINLTAIYAVYAGGALIGLLTTGRLSDHVGRRRVVIGALVVQIAGMGAFMVADGVGLLYAGRILQGVATGVAAGAISAWMLDLQPPENPRLGGLVGGVALIAGLGVGALGSALLVRYAPYPLRLVYWVLAAVYALALAAMIALPDVVERTAGALRSMRPRIGVPRAARSAFVALAPSLIATWALGGLYLALGPSLAASLLKSDSRIAGGFVILALMGAGGVASAVVHAADAGAMVIRGSLVLIVGVAVTLLAVALGWTAGLYAGSVIAGLGFGPAFSGVMRSLAPLAPPHERGALLASIYIAIYLSFSVPTVIAGIAVARYSLRETTFVYGVAVMALAAITTVAVSRRRTSVEIGH